MLGCLAKFAVGPTGMPQSPRQKSKQCCTHQFDYDRGPFGKPCRNAGFQHFNLNMRTLARTKRDRPRDNDDQRQDNRSSAPVMGAFKALRMTKTFQT